MSSLPDTDEDEETDTNEQLRATSCLPIQLRWDSIEKLALSSQTKITLPLEPDTEKNLEQLVKDMAPTTFGLGGEHVYDESYRKATKLDPTRFSSTSTRTNWESLTPLLERSCLVYATRSRIGVSRPSCTSSTQPVDPALPNGLSG